MATTTVEPTTSQTTNTPQGGPATPARRAPGGQKRTLIAVGIGAAVVAVGGYIALAGGGRKEQFAQRQLLEARGLAETGQLAQASADFQKIITTYGGTDAAAEAAISLNQARLVNGQTELAVVGLRDFLKTGPKAQFAVPANGLLGSALENAQKYGEAAAAYEKAADLATESYLKSDYLVNAGRAYRLAGKPGEAERIYRTVIEKYSTTPSVTEAQVRLAELTKGKLPPVPEQPKSGAESGS
ncbi:MAG TPA: tetratricopeptide repeat protein [Gemmatimonadales bacterium]|nr:tetratricopeptide repeat protein [Gemmatimonadales bacterium]